MVVEGTPIERYGELGLYVKREDLCCPGGPNFSKTRGVYAHVSSRPEATIGVLDTSHSQGGWAVARACSLLGKHCVLFYPVRVREEFDPLRPQQLAARELGAELVPIPAGRSAILYHRATRYLRDRGHGTYMMPNALKLVESVQETAAEVGRIPLPGVDVAVVSASSATIAAGVLAGLQCVGWRGKLIIHMGYSRSHSAVQKYVSKLVPWSPWVEVVDEGYTYADKARPGIDPPFPCNEYYDLKALRWWCRDAHRPPALFWNIG